MKAYLVYKNIKFKSIHNLEILIKLCAEKDDSFKCIDAGNLSQYAVETRYPDNFYIPSITEAAEAINIADTIKRFVIAKIEEPD